MCTSLLVDEKPLRDIGLTDANIEAVLDEIRIVTAS
jgi:hypothetical protein